jgi:hypothetical protein
MRRLAYCWMSAAAGDYRIRNKEQRGCVACQERSHELIDRARRMEIVPQLIITHTSHSPGWPTNRRSVHARAPGFRSRRLLWCLWHLAAVRRIGRRRKRGRKREEKRDADIFAAARAEVVLQTALEKRSASPLCYPHLHTLHSLRSVFLRKSSATTVVVQRIIPIS